MSDIIFNDEQKISDQSEEYQEEEEIERIKSEIDCRILNQTYKLKIKLLEEKLKNFSKEFFIASV